MTVLQHLLAVAILSKTYLITNNRHSQTNDIQSSDYNIEQGLNGRVLINGTLIGPPMAGRGGAFKVLLMLQVTTTYERM